MLKFGQRHLEIKNLILSKPLSANIHGTKGVIKVVTIHLWKIGSPELLNVLEKME